MTALGNRELLALVLGHGAGGRSALEIAVDILRETGGLHGLSKVGPDRLRRLDGMGPAQSSRVLAGIELGRRTLLLAPNARLPLREASEVAAFLLPMFGAHSTERFGAVLLDSRLRLLRVHLVSEGSLDSALAIPRDVLREATTSGAGAVVVFHNHPSGDVHPTRADLEVTARLVDAGKIVGIDVIDHLILGDTVYCSIRKVATELWRG